MKRLLYIPLLFAAACGDDGASGDDTIEPDADPASVCAALGDIAGSISAYPGSYSGTVLGGGADLTAADGTCTVNDWYDPVGEDVVVSLTGLTVGETYAVILDSADDLGFYVLSGCDVADGTVQGSCDVFEDVSLGGEEYTFTASGTSGWIVVDTGSDSADLATGNFELRVFVAECEDSSGCSGATPQCVDYACVECATDFDCAAGTPSCDLTTNECVAGYSSCTGDDAGDTTAPGDDGPTVATALSLPSKSTATTVDASVCNVPVGEADYYTFTVTGDVTYGFGLTWASATADLDMYLLDSVGEVVEAGTNFDQEPEGFMAELGAGTYYLYVTQYGPENTAAASAYTLSFAIPECTDDYDCVSGEPICSGAGTCGPSTGVCTSDDAGDTATGGDDGPNGGRDLTAAIDVAATLTGQGICNAAGETDFYRVTTTTAGESLAVTLDWADGTKDLDVMVLDADGNILGASFWKRPEVVNLSHLPVGTYYLRVDLIDMNDITDASTVPYSITAQRDDAVSCGTPGLGSASCAATYSTQVYRGECLASGACGMIAAGTRADGMACDTADDCNSGRCSYIVFEKDAHLSVCTTTCTATSACSALAGTTCTTGFTTNQCVPACADNLSCGARPTSMTIDTDQPWDYLTCSNPGASGTCGTP